MKSVEFQSKISILIETVEIIPFEPLKNGKMAGTNRATTAKGEGNQDATDLTNAAEHVDNDDNYDEDQLVDVQLAEIIGDDDDELYDV